MSECLIIRSLLWMSYFRVVQLETIHYLLKLQRQKLEEARWGHTCQERKRERETRIGNLALIFFLFSEANIYPEDLKRKADSIQLWQPLLVLREKNRVFGKIIGSKLLFFIKLFDLPRASSS